jgi:hypothetical protein
VLQNAAGVLRIDRMNIFEEALHLAAKAIIVKSEVEPIEAERRFAVCLGCDKRDADKNQCGICHCFLDLKCGSKVNWNAIRIRNEITHCPLGRWGDIEITNMYRQMDGKEILTQ